MRDLGYTTISPEPSAFAQTTAGHLKTTCGRRPEGAGSFLRSQTPDIEEKYFDLPLAKLDRLMAEYSPETQAFVSEHVGVLSFPNQEILIGQIRGDVLRVYPWTFRKRMYSTPKAISQVLGTCFEETPVPAMARTWDDVRNGLMVTNWLSYNGAWTRARKIAPWAKDRKSLEKVFSNLLNQKLFDSGALEGASFHINLQAGTINDEGALLPPETSGRVNGPGYDILRSISTGVQSTVLRAFQDEHPAFLIDSWVSQPTSGGHSLTQGTLMSIQGRIQQSFVSRHTYFEALSTIPEDLRPHFI